MPLLFASPSERADYLLLKPMKSLYIPSFNNVRGGGGSPQAPPLQEQTKLCYRL